MNGPRVKQKKSSCVPHFEDFEMSSHNCSFQTFLKSTAFSMAWDVSRLQSACWLEKVGTEKMPEAFGAWKELVAITEERVSTKRRAA